MIVIEDPLPEDAAEIFFVQRQTWHESYLDQLSHEDIERRFVDAPEKIERIKQVIDGKTDGKFFVARDKEHEKILGFISLQTIPHNEINSLYMIASSQGLGLGRKLMEKSLEWFGNQDIYVCTHSHNIQNFYEKFGFEFVKNIPEKEGFDKNIQLLRAQYYNTTRG
jgi:ribosomal protein S18 acetylase RimI-like enzyme